MAFIQLIEVRSSKVDEIQALDRDWERSTDDKRTLRRSIVARDRNDPNRVFIIAFFDSYESAMENSNLPETQAFAEQVQTLVDEVSFTDLDVIDDRP